MKADYKTLHEIRILGFDALIRELGPAGAIRFIQQYEVGKGDYSRERHKFLPQVSVKELGEKIYEERNAT
ncbi:MAG: hypothetical protein D6770_00915 [Anaerolineae bacterium]|nr:MAG: hypothetical protein D6770_00915 [Anaerolineae bacterium]